VTAARNKAQSNKTRRRRGITVVLHSTGHYEKETPGKDTMYRVLAETAKMQKRLEAATATAAEASA
jgi:hypothetical protein